MPAIIFYTPFYLDGVSDGWLFMAELEAKGWMIPEYHFLEVLTHPTLDLHQLTR